MKYDLIIVALSSKVRLIEMTQRCIDSARQDGANLNIIIVETHSVIHEYQNIDKLVQYKGDFCYNRALNEGLRHANGDIHILANNDLIFHEGWSEIGEAMKINGYGSASVLSSWHIGRGMRKGDFIYPGYRIEYEIAGWCIFITRESLQKIGKLDESFEFWHSDNMYAEQLKSHSINHGLFCNVQIDHLESVTLRSVSSRYQRRYTAGSVIKYNQMNYAK